MNTYAGWDYVGADGSYPEVAARAVMSTYHQSPSPVYGYLRAGAQQKIYLFHALEQGRAWYEGLVHGRMEPYDYVALFVATNLRGPIAEDFGHAMVSGDAEVGQLWPLALGIPAGALGGYFYRKWQEGHPGKFLPWISGEMVGAAPWVDIVGAEAPDVARRQAWAQTKALIKSAVREVLDAQNMYPAQAYVWSLEAPGPSPSARVELYGTTQIVPFASSDQALAHLRDRIHTEHVALALFDRSSPHWPNPVNWTKSHDPAHESVIAQQVAKYAPAQAAGEFVGAWPWHSIVGAESVGAVPWHSIVGAEGVGAESVGAGPWYTIIGAALDVLRRQAKAAAEEMPGRVIGVLRDARGKWQLKSFRTLDDADDWFGYATSEPRDFSYAAYFEKDRNGIPYLENEKIGGGRAASVPGAPIHREIASVTVAP